MGGKYYDTEKCKEIAVLPLDGILYTLETKDYCRMHCCSLSGEEIGRKHLVDGDGVEEVRAMVAAG